MMECVCISKITWPIESEPYCSALNDIVEKLANERPISIVLTGGLYARSSLLCENHADARERLILTELAIVNNFEEHVGEPTHIRNDGTQTCIDVMFTSQPSAFTNVKVIPHPERYLNT